MSKCAFCNKKSSVLLKCKFCNYEHCTKCRLQTIHNCKNMQLCKEITQLKLKEQIETNCYKKRKLDVL